MKYLFRIAALVLVLAQLFVISAAAGNAPKSSVEKMKAAMNGTSAVKTSGAAEGSAAAVNAETAAREKKIEEAKKAADAKKKVDYEIAPVTQFGSTGDVMIGGLAIHPGVWYTVKDGVLMSSEPWPDSYLYYSASQSKITLHEFHYRVPTDTIGKETTYAALYLPKDMHLVLEGENELINTSYTTAGGGVSNGVYAPDHHISVEGDGTLYVNTRSADGFKGYGIEAGSIRIDSEFTGLAVFGMTSAFSCAPTVAEASGAPSKIATYYSGYEDYVRVNNDLKGLGAAYGFDVPNILSAAQASVPLVSQGRKMIANVADLHPQYHENVHVREASPYDRSIFTRFRYVLLAVGDELSPEQEAREKIEAEYYRNKMEYNLGVEAGYAEAFDTYITEAGNGIMEFAMAMDQEMNAINSQNFDVNIEVWDENSASTQLAQMLMGAG